MPPKPKNLLHFTKPALDKISPPATGRIYSYDDETRGLAFVVTANGHRSFELIRRIGQKVERHHLGNWPSLTIENARRQAVGLNGQIATKGVNPNDGRRRERSAPTLGELFEEYLLGAARGKRKRPRSAKTVKDYRWQFDNRLEEWKDRRVSSISRQDVEALHARLGRDHGAYLANRVLSLLKAMFNHALDAELLDKNPARNVRPFEERSRDRAIQAAELPALWAALESEPDADFFRLALFTGARRGNVVTARWDQIDLAAAEWRIPITKGGRPLLVPLSGPAVEILKKRRKSIAGEWVFPGLDGSAPMAVPKHAWNRIRKAAGVPDLRIHDLRRSLASWQASTGANLSTIGKSLGHASIEATKIYAHADLAAVRQSVETATAAILAAATPAGKSRRRGAAPYDARRSRKPDASPDASIADRRASP